mmetsp:Transcript_22962/g.49755  ORF Transcript_22962/g.49755 Transcript_22962/m.49755 type:complete len:498 (+) Transcript_22962:85-1578(+)
MLQQSLSSSAAAATPQSQVLVDRVITESCPALKRNLTIRGGGGTTDMSKQTTTTGSKQSPGASKNRSTTAATASSTGTTPKKYPAWHSAVAGAAAGAGSRLLTAPLDLLRIRRQLQLDHPPSQSVSAAAFTDAIQSAGHKPVGAKAIDAARDAAARAAAQTAAERAQHPILQRFGGFGLFSSLAQIARDEGGIRSLFRGNVAATYLWITYAAVQFSLYARTSDFINGFALPAVVSPGTGGDAGTTDYASCSSTSPFPLLPAPIRHTLSGIASSKTAVAFASGATAGLGATLTTYPFDLCRTAFAARGLHTSSAASAASATSAAAATTTASSSASGLAPPQSLLGFARTLYRRKGIRGFYAGASPAAVQIVPYMGINFAMYDYFTRTFDKSSVGGAGLAGTIAGGTSKLLVYPLDTIKKRLQAQATIGLNHRQYKSMVDCAVTMMKEEGFAAFYRGLVPTVLKSCSATGLTFAMYTFSKNILEGIHDGMAKKESRPDE